MSYLRIKDESRGSARGECVGMVLRQREYSGLFVDRRCPPCIPPPGYRKERLPETVLGKVECVSGYARGEKLLPVFLGDLFHYARDNDLAVGGAYPPFL